jgi:hypothetical protein
MRRSLGLGGGSPVGAALLNGVALPVVDNSTTPEQWAIAAAGTASGTADNSLVYEEDEGLAIYNVHEISTVAGAGADSLNVFVKHIGSSTYEATAVQLVDRSLVVGAVIQSTNDIKAVGNYILNGRFGAVKVVQLGATISAAYQVRGSHHN